AQVQVIGRHIDRDQRLGAAAAIDRELLGEKPHHPSAPVIFYHHHAFEAVLVVRRERDDQLLHRRVDGPEPGHHHQPALGARHHPPADHVGRQRAHRQQEHAGHEHADGHRHHPREGRLAAHYLRGQRRRETINDTEDPRQRRQAHEQRDREEEPRQERAPQPRHHNRPAAISASRIAPAAIRYHANGANPERPTNRRNGLTTTSDARKAITKPTAMTSTRAPVSEWRASIRSCTKAAAMVGMARKNENSAAVVRSSPMTRPPTIVPPDRDTPGTSASAWQKPMPRARENGSASTESIVGRGRKRSTRSI